MFENAFTSNKVLRTSCLIVRDRASSRPSQITFQFAGKQPLTRRPAPGDPHATAGYPSSAVQPHGLTCVANDRRPAGYPHLNLHGSTRATH